MAARKLFSQRAWRLCGSDHFARRLDGLWWRPGRRHSADKQNNPPKIKPQHKYECFGANTRLNCLHRNRVAGRQFLWRSTNLCCVWGDIVALREHRDMAEALQHKKSWPAERGRSGGREHQQATKHVSRTRDWGSGAYIGAHHVGLPALVTAALPLVAWHLCRQMCHGRSLLVLQVTGSFDAAHSAGTNQSRRTPS